MAIECSVGGKKKTGKGKGNDVINDPESEW